MHLCQASELLSSCIFLFQDLLPPNFVQLAFMYMLRMNRKFDKTKKIVKLIYLPTSSVKRLQIRKLKNAT